MAKLKYLCIHCSATPPVMKVTRGMLEEWHLAPRDLPDGRVRYNGKTYENRDELPEVLINGKPIRELSGRGWRKVGYSDMIHRAGNIENLTSYDEDDQVESWEITNGAAGFNSVCRHICLIGGLDENMKSKIFDFFEIFTDGQFTSLISYCNNFLKQHPECKIIGHYDLTDKKTCPNFNVPEVLTVGGIEEKYIGLFVSKDQKES